MSATINVYSLPQVVNLVLGGNTGASLMNYPVNSTTFKVTKGVTNEILFFVRDVDRQSVTLANAPVAVISSGETLLAQTPMTVYDANNAIWMLSFSPTDTQDWPLGAARYSIMSPRPDGSQVLLYTDRAYGPYSYVEVLDGPFPLPPEAITLTADDMIILDGSLQTGSLPGAAQVGNISGLQQVTVDLNGYIGNVVVQASLDAQPQDDSDWADVLTLSYADLTTGPQYAQFNGNFMWVRFRVQVFNPNAGNYNVNYGAGYENPAMGNSVSTFTSLTYRAD